MIRKLKTAGRCVAALAMLAIAAGEGWCWTPLKISLIPPIAVPGSKTVIGWDAGIITQTDEVIGKQDALLGIAGKVVGMQNGYLLAWAGESYGTQFGLFFAHADKGYALQASYGIAWANEFTGSQIGCITVTGKSTGMQWGIVNYASNHKGMQIGVVNVCGRLEGFQLGVLNIIGSGDKMLPAFVGFNLGYGQKTVPAQEKGQ